MRRSFTALVAVIAVAGVLGASPRQDARAALSVDDPEIRALVERFFATQAAEDADAYLFLWSASGPRPTAAQLKFIFDSGDDTFSEVAISRVTLVGDRVTVRVSAMRNRTDARNLGPDGAPARYHTRLALALILAREGGGWKIVGEGAPADALASALIDAPTSAARAALMDAEADLVGEALVAAMSRRADALARGGDFAGARVVYELVVEVARRAGSRRSEGQALQNIGNAAYFQRDFDAALDAYRRRLALEREASNDDGLSEALVGVATVQYSRYEYTDALASYREAAAIQERLGDGNALGTTLISTGNVQYLQGDYEGAIADYRRSRDLLRKAFNLASESRALEGMGRACAAQGNFAAALEAFAGVVAEGIARRSDAMLGTARQNIGDVHFRLGNLDAARTAFDESRAHFEAAKDPASAGHAWQAIAITELVSTRFGAAEQAYARSMAACGAAGDRECIARATVGLAFAQASQERYDEAIATYRKGIAAFVALGKTLEAARGEIGLSQAYLGSRDYTLALAAATRAREAATPLSSQDVLWRASAAQGRAWRRLGAADKAMLAAREAVTILQGTMQAGTRNPAQRAAADGVSAFALLALLLAEAGDPPAAFVTLEERRAYALRAALATNEREIWRGMSVAERDEERTLSAAVVSLAVRIEQEKQLPKPDVARLDMLKTRLNDAMEARSAQQQRLFEKLPALRVWRGLAPAASLQELLAALPSSTTLVEIAIDEDDLVVVTVAPGETAPDIKADVRPVRRQTLAEKVAALTEERLRDASESRRVAAEIAALFPEAALARLASASSVILVPDDILWRVPFEALPAGAGLVADTTVVTYAGSLASLLAPAAAAAGTAPLLAVAAPEIGPDRIDRIKATAPSWVPRAAGAAEDEARRVASAFGNAAVIMSAGDASEATLRARMPEATLLHVAAPFRVSGASPLFSRVYLSGSAIPSVPDDPSDDGALDAREVFNLEARATMIALTDGSAAGGRDAAAAWPIVHWAWRAAGMRHALVARWSTDAAVASELLADFYARIKAGEAAPAALRGAQERIRARDETRAPQFWAGWMLIGR